MNPLQTQRTYRVKLRHIKITDRVKHEPNRKPSRKRWHINMWAR